MFPLPFFLFFNIVFSPIASYNFRKVALISKSLYGLTSLSSISLEEGKANKQIDLTSNQKVKSKFGRTNRVEGISRCILELDRLKNIVSKSDSYSNDRKEEIILSSINVTDILKSILYSGAPEQIPLVLGRINSFIEDLDTQESIDAFEEHFVNNRALSLTAARSNSILGDLAATQGIVQKRARVSRSSTIKLSADEIGQLASTLAESGSSNGIQSAKAFLSAMLGQNYSQIPLSAAQGMLSGFMMQNTALANSLANDVWGQRNIIASPKLDVVSADLVPQNKHLEQIESNLASVKYRDIISQVQGRKPLSLYGTALRIIIKNELQSHFSAKKFVPRHLSGLKEGQSLLSDYNINWTSTFIQIASEEFLFGCNISDSFSSFRSLVQIAESSSLNATEVSSSMGKALLKLYAKKGMPLQAFNATSIFGFNESEPTIQELLLQSCSNCANSTLAVNCLINSDEDLCFPPQTRKGWESILAIAANVNESKLGIGDNSVYKDDLWRRAIITGDYMALLGYMAENDVLPGYQTLCTLLERLVVSDKVNAATILFAEQIKSESRRLDLFEAAGAVEFRKKNASLRSIDSYLPGPDINSLSVVIDGLLSKSRYSEAIKLIRVFATVSKRSFSLAGHPMASLQLSYDIYEKLLAGFASIALEEYKANGQCSNELIKETLSAVSDIQDAKFDISPAGYDYIVLIFGCARDIGSALGALEERISIYGLSARALQLFLESCERLDKDNGLVHAISLLEAIDNRPGSDLAQYSEDILLRGFDQAEQLGHALRAMSSVSELDNHSKHRIIRASLSVLSVLVQFSRRGSGKKELFDTLQRLAVMGIRPDEDIEEYFDFAVNAEDAEGLFQPSTRTQRLQSKNRAKGRSLLNLSLLGDELVPMPQKLPLLTVSAIKTSNSNGALNNYDACTDNPWLKHESLVCSMRYQTTVPISKRSNRAKRVSNKAAAGSSRATSSPVTASRAKTRNVLKNI